MSAAALMSADNITVRYGGLIAVAGVSLSIASRTTPS